MPIANIEKLDAIIEPALRTARIPGAAIAVVAGGGVFARGYGYRDLDLQLPMTVDTVYPIASTTKAINATLLGMLVERGQLAWDAPVQQYLPRFRLQDPLASLAVTVRDLVAMRTGLPRHDFVWLENPIDRAALVGALAQLPLSAGLRERFQYNNLTVTLAGHIAEIVTGQSWEELVRKNIFEPLQMSDTGFALPAMGNVAVSYHENGKRKPVRNCRFDTQMTAPAGGAIHSTVNDMARWIAFNLNGGKAAGHQLIAPATLQELHSPCVVMGADPVAPSPNAAYGLGWAIDTCNGRARISHGGDLHDTISCVTLFPENAIGIVSVVNLAIPRIARAINQCVFDLVVEAGSEQTIGRAVAEYEAKIHSIRLSNHNLRRVCNTSPSHCLDDYVGTYLHAGYGQIAICRQGQTLIFARGNLVLPLEHWHYDAWAVAENDRFQIYKPYAFDRSSRIVFETSADGVIAALSMQLEPAVAPVRFEKRQMENATHPRCTLM